MIALAALFGAAAGVIGTLISVSDAALPTGPMIILSLTAIVIVSLFFAPERGLVWDALRRWEQRRALRAEAEGRL
jgi:manganese/zinc/iron transport system permease protein